MANPKAPDRLRLWATTAASIAFQSSPMPILELDRKSLSNSLRIAAGVELGKGASPRVAEKPNSLQAEFPSDRFEVRDMVVEAIAVVAAEGPPRPTLIVPENSMVGGEQGSNVGKVVGDSRTTVGEDNRTAGLAMAIDRKAHSRRLNKGNWRHQRLSR